MIDSGMEIQNETHRAGEDFAGASGVTTECDDWQTINEVTELIFGQNTTCQPQVSRFCKIPLVCNELEQNFNFYAE